MGSRMWFQTESNMNVVVVLICTNENMLEEKNGPILPTKKQQNTFALWHSGRISRLEVAALKGAAAPLGAPQGCNEALH